MFEVDSNTKKITMHRGDTGSVTFTANGFDWSEVTAKAVFTMKKKDQTIKEVVSDLPASGEFTVEFENEDTDFLQPGVYEYDVRVVINPVLDGNGKITDGTVVRTPWDPIPVEIRRTVGQI